MLVDVELAGELCDHGGRSQNKAVNSTVASWALGQKFDEEGLYLACILEELTEREGFESAA
jgi:hypothetical protein